MRYRLLAAVLFAAIAAATVPASDPVTSDAPREVTLSGQVFDVTGTAASGAMVRCRSIEEVKPSAKASSAGSTRKYWKPREGSKTAWLFTGEDGGFAIACGEGELFRIRIEHSGHAPRIVDELTADGGAVEVRLTSGERLDGRVMDGGTSAGVAGATARLCDEQSGIFGLATCATTVSDETGAFRLVDLAPGRHELSLHEAAHARKSLPDVEVPQPVAPDSDKPAPLLVFLGPGGTLRGTLVTHSGEKSANIPLYAEVHHPDGESRGVERGDRTGADGTFDFEGLRAGVPYRLRAKVEGFAPLSEGPFTVAAGETRELRLVLTQGATLRFRLVDEDGQPVTANKVRCHGTEGTRSSNYDGERLEIGDDGQHTLRAVPAGTTSVTIYTDCCADLVQEDLELGEQPSIDLGTLALERGSTIAGTVRDTSGKPVPGASVSVNWRDGKRFSSKKTETDETGAYRAAGIDDEVVTRVTASKEGFVESKLEDVAAGSHDVDLVMVRSGTISGNVVLPDGSPCTKFEIEAHRTDSTERGGPMGITLARPVLRSYTEPDGKFSVSGLDPGTYTVLARAKGMAPARRADLVVESDAIATAGTLALRPGVTLSGRVVTSEDERPIPGAAVLAVKPEMFRFSSSQSAGDVRAVADLEGRFVLEGLDSGVVVISATHRDHSPAEERIELAEGEEPAPVVLVLGAGGRLTGTVRDGEGQPVAAAEIRIQRGLMRMDPLEATTDEAGRYTFEQLAAGSYTAVCMERKATGTGGGDLDAKTVHIDEGRTTVLDFKREDAVRLSGRVLRGGEPVPEVTLMFMSGNFTAGGQPSIRSTSVDGAGRYSVGLARGGTYQVSILGGEAPLPATIKLEVPEESEVVRDLELEEGGIIEGAVVDLDGRPIAKAVVAAAPSTLQAAVEQIRQAFTGADGRYVVSGLDSGAHRITAVAQGYARAEQSVTLAEERQTVDFQLEQGATLRGRVVDPQDNPISGAIVFATAPGSPSAFQGSSHAASGLDGAFEVNVPFGSPVDLLVLAMGWAPGVARNVVADEAPGGSEQLIRLGSGGRLRVSATTSDGRPVSGLTLTLEPLDPTQARFVGLFMAQQLARQPTGTDGTTVLTLIAPGSYRVSAIGRTVVEAVNVTVHEGQESDARLTVTD